MRLIHIQNEKISETALIRKTVGDLNQYGNFESEVFSWTTETSFYLFSDGIVDQIGGERNKRYSKKQFYEQLVAIAALPMPEQKNRMTESFTNWKGREKQTDDILVIGFRAS